MFATVRTAYVSLTPPGHIEKPKDVADVVAFLASELALVVKGKAVCVRSGAWMNWLGDQKPVGITMKRRKRIASHRRVASTLNVDENSLATPSN